MLETTFSNKLEQQPIIKSQVQAAGVSSILNSTGDKIKVLSLDCFDTLLWRRTATPRDIFYAMQKRPLFQSSGVTAYQRIKAAAKAYRHKFITEGTRQITLNDIYRNFTALSLDQQLALAQDELQTEIENCYAYSPFVELIRAAKLRGMKVVIVSDTYLTEAQLRLLLQHHLPSDVMSAIDTIIVSCEYHISKSEGLFQHVINKVSEV